MIKCILLERSKNRPKKKKTSSKYTLQKHFCSLTEYIMNNLCLLLNILNLYHFEWLLVCFLIYQSFFSLPLEMFILLSFFGVGREPYYMKRCEGCSYECTFEHIYDFSPAQFLEVELIDYSFTKGLILILRIFL